MLQFKRSFTPLQSHHSPVVLLIRLRSHRTMLKIENQIVQVLEPELGLSIVTVKLLK